MGIFLIGVSLVAFAWGILKAALSRQLGEELRAWLPWVVERSIALAVKRLPVDQQDRYTEEWHSHLEEIPGEIGKLLFALGLFPAGLRMSRTLHRASEHSSRNTRRFRSHRVASRTDAKDRPSTAAQLRQPINNLLRAQVLHAAMLEEKMYPLDQRTGIDPARIQTEGEAAAYLQSVYAKMHS